ncbi:DNA translocase FtsK 4TM domain-containing protein, partial [Amaricoccus sp.]|uniref:DNA translocase FtsK 4TM domain-containing protein n=1 Tax=Amaricoccus sp. TaxID=1872485 RepID=UPI002D1FBC1E
MRRRGTELLGLILLALAALAGTMIWTYSPDDPSLFSATDAAPQNALGLVGASIADPMHRALGWAAYGIPVALAAWGLRLLLHAGETRAVSRAIAVPVALLAAAAFAATHVPLSGWQFDYGLGGMLGDAAVGGLVSLMPLDLTLALTITSLALAFAFALTTGYALGVTWAEMRGFLAFLSGGSVLLYSGLYGLTGRAVATASEGARAAHRSASELRARRAEAAEASLPKPGALRAEGIPRFDPAALRPSEDSVMAKITAAVRARAEADATSRSPALRPIPPLTAAHAETAVLERDDIEETESDPDLDREILPQPRVRVPAAKPLVKSARARSEEQPQLALDGDAPEIYRTPPLSLLQSPSTIVRHH